MNSTGKEEEEKIYILWFSLTGYCGDGDQFPARLRTGNLGLQQRRQPGLRFWQGTRQGIETKKKTSPMDITCKSLLKIRGWSYIVLWWVLGRANGLKKNRRRRRSRKIKGVATPYDSGAPFCLQLMAIKHNTYYLFFFQPYSYWWWQFPKCWAPICLVA